VNILAHKALLAVYGKGKHQVGLREVLAAVSDTKSIESIWKKMHLHGLSFTLFISVLGSALLVYPQ
jgi:MSHA biogenesis protein MshM